MTVNNRLKEFESTPSSKLTLDQILNHQLGGQADPPNFTSNRIKEARALAVQKNNTILRRS